MKLIQLSFRFLLALGLIIIFPLSVVRAAGPLVKVTSTPSGALITINDLAQPQRTPAVLKNMVEGKKYKIRIDKKGYKPFEKSLKVAAGTNEIHGDLEPVPKKEEKPPAKETKNEPSSSKEKKEAKDESGGTKVEQALGYNKAYKEGTYGWLEVNTIPNGAVVYINEDRQVGPTPNKYKTPIGTVKVSVVIKGKALREFSNVKIKAGETTTLEPIDFRDETQRPNTKPLLK